MSWRRITLGEDKVAIEKKVAWLHVERMRMYRRCWLFLEAEMVAWEKEVLTRSFLLKYSS